LNLPNRLTVARIASIPLILVFMLPIPVGGELFSRWNAFILHYGMMAALFLFIIASITDFLDGRIARNMGIVTNTGKLMDPIADKLLVISVLVALTQLGRLSAIIVIIILAREFLITGVRMLAASRGQVVAADRSGKIKTVFQMTAIILLLLQISCILRRTCLSYWRWPQPCFPESAISVQEWLFCVTESAVWAECIDNRRNFI
jgi:CDP-diacylglycerol--glycerol-3-phosphate 3-phosphatidyltransferase